ncbi:MAG: tetratricopeptide repeat-containing glycosyltransferase family protein [Bryobacterales bacterium]|nr:tetratricopeptide repeat-containing glycosyltransferase family protein [Bryobacteraceae bacterium]MDW8131873.1 tetratricopeptide repeat-containing glycosyltransferase family protein [Bryobacterales bacterium]
MWNPIQALEMALEHQQRGRWAEAERIYGEVLAQCPDHADALHLLGVLRAQTGNPTAAAALIARAIARNPLAPAYHNNLGNVMQELGRLEESLLCYEEALRLAPDYFEALVNRGNALNKLDRFPEAICCYLEAQRLRPDDPSAYVNLARALVEESLLEDALACADQALRLDPENAQAHAVRALAWLLAGDLERGFAEYEWRWRLEPHRRRDFPQPLWDGSPLSGRRILLHAEQGLGDTIQFLRYAPLVAARGGCVVIECQPALLELAATVEGVAQIVAAGDPLPEFDVHAPLLSLPRLMGTTLETIPRQVPYLTAPQRAGEPPSLPGKGPRVGLAWAGNPAHANDRRRSLDLDALAPLGQVEGVTFVSLQSGPRAEQAASPPPGLRLEELPQPWRELPWLAAIVAQLDLVITVDTMHAHLAGALGRPVWVLLPFAPDWRWMLGREDSPWYPTMRLFRQRARGAWGEVVGRVAEQLRATVREEKCRS